MYLYYWVEYDARIDDAAAIRLNFSSESTGGQKNANVRLAVAKVLN